MADALPEYIGHFRVVGLLGKGAMGEVYEGFDEQLNRRVALKILGRKHQESSEFKTRFLREGRALAAMNHRNIVQVYAIGQHEERPFLAMEYLDGEDVAGGVGTEDVAVVGHRPVGGEQQTFQTSDDVPRLDPDFIGRRSALHAGDPDPADAVGFAHDRFTVDTESVDVPTRLDGLDHGQDLIPSDGEVLVGGARPGIVDA